MADVPNPEKKVDESWKEKVAQEQKGENEKKTEVQPEAEKQPQAEEAEHGAPPEVNFSLFLSTLGMQAYMALGELADPVSKTKKVNLPQAKYMIDLITMLHEKTQGNLTSEEEKMISSVLYELQMKYVKKTEAS